MGELQQMVPGIEMGEEDSAVWLHENMEGVRHISDKEREEESG